MEARSKWDFLWDVFVAALGSYGGPEAHYGIFSQQLVEKKGYLTEEDLAELIGLYSLVPGPGSTQVITAIGYHVGGPWLAFWTFIVWALPAIFVMALIGVFFSQVDGQPFWDSLMTFLPAVAVAFIVLAAWNMTTKQVQATNHTLLYLIMLLVCWFFAGQSIWAVPIILIIGGLSVMVPQWSSQRGQSFNLRINGWFLAVLVAIALVNEILRIHLDQPLINTFASFYRYGYSAMGGGQIVIPLMIQDLVETQSLLSLADFQSGYAIDQAVPGPLFSFAAFVAARSFAGSGYALVAGLIGGLAIFTPGILLVYTMFPLWKSMQDHTLSRAFLKGVSVTVAALITVTALRQILTLEVTLPNLAVFFIVLILLFTKKVPAPVIVLGALVLGLLA